MTVYVCYFVSCPTHFHGFGRRQQLKNDIEYMTVLYGKVNSIVTRLYLHQLLLNYMTKKLYSYPVKLVVLLLFWSPCQCLSDAFFPLIGWKSYTVTRQSSHVFFPLIGWKRGLSAHLFHRVHEPAGRTCSGQRLYNQLFSYSTTA